MVAGCGGCNSRLFLSSFIAAGKKNIMRKTNFNRKSNSGSEQSHQTRDINFEETLLSGAYLLHSLKDRLTFILNLLLGKRKLLIF